MADCAKTSTVAYRVLVRSADQPFAVCAQVSPTTLFFVQGSGQSWSGAMCWGDGFITERPKIAATGMSDPNPFFLQLLAKPYLYNVVISPHYYPPSISHSTADYTGAALYK